LSWIEVKLHISLLIFAIRRDPMLFIRAVLWRLRGLRVRSRNTMSALMAGSPAAYQLWIVRGARNSPTDDINVEGLGTHITYVVIAGDAGSSGIMRTLRSIRAADNSAQILLFDANGESARLVDSGGIQNIRHSASLGDFIAQLLQCVDGWLCPLMAGDALAAEAIRIYRSSIMEKDASVYYCDDDLMDEGGNRFSPHFKADWNPELFRHQDYLSFSCVFKANAENLRLLPPQLDAEVIIRSLVHAAVTGSPTVAPVHIAQILHHLGRRHLHPITSAEGHPQQVPAMTDEESVTIIIPTKNGFDLISNCIKGVEDTAYKNKEVIIIDHESDDPRTVAFLKDLSARGYKIVQWAGVFNYSAMNNYAATFSQNEFLCFLNNDIEMTDGQWLSLLVRQARRTDVGAVGAKLLYPDATIQHAGVVIGVGGAAGHAHRHCPNDDPGYFDRPHLPQFVTAVTAACMVVQRKKFDAVGGFDEERFPVAFNDVDLCLKLVRAGWQSFYEPRAVLIHHESKSRGSDRLRKNRKRFAGELQALKDKWQTDRIRDPYHNPNLSRLTEQFLIDI
jgi:O-antigen biosynthesis protein